MFYFDDGLMAIVVVWISMLPLAPRSCKSSTLETVERLLNTVMGGNIVDIERVS